MSGKLCSGKVVNYSAEYASFIYSCLLFFQSTAFDTSGELNFGKDILKKISPFFNGYISLPKFMTVLPIGPHQPESTIPVFIERTPFWDNPFLTIAYPKTSSGIFNISSDITVTSP